MTDEELYFASDFFIYEVDFAVVTAGLSTSAFFTVQADSDFFLSKWAVTGTDNADGAIPSTEPITASILITDTGSGRNLSNLAVPVSNFFGSGQLPFILPRQRIFIANSTVNVQLTNYGADTYNTIKLSFIGEKKFRRGRA